jgi:hypothetical protein
MAEGYETFVRDLADLHEGREVPLVLRDLRPGRHKYFARNVVGVVTAAGGDTGVGSDAADGAGDWAPLVVRSAAGHRFPGAWRVRIVRVLPTTAPGAPYKDAYAALRAAWEGGADR